MSSRAIKKFFGNEDLALKNGDDNSENEGVEEEEEEEAVVKKNPFEMLGGSDDYESDEEEQAAHENEVAKEKPVEKKTEEEENKPKKKKNKKKNKKKGKKAAPPADKKVDKEDDDIDDLIASVKETDIKDDRPDWFKFLSIDTKYLDHELEFRKLFGKEAMKNDTLESSTIFPKPTSTPKDWGGKDGRQVPGTNRKLVFSKVRPHFLPTVKREIMMEQVHEPEDEVYKTTSFKFVHTEPYSQAQRLFQYLLSVSDPQTIINQVLPKSFYHTPTLMMIAENLVQGGGQHQEAADMIERCLLVFDRAFKPQFLFDGSCRLPFKYFENRSFYQVLMKHLKVLMRRGTWTTAFEFAKFLWSLSPELDPYGAGHMIDVFAISAAQEQYILDLAENKHFSECHAHRPNILYSRALAHHILYPQETKQTKEYMKLAISKFPWVASMLLDNSFETEYTALPEQQILGQLYVIQMKSFWEKWGLLKPLAKQVDKVQLDPIQQSERVSPEVVRYALVCDQKEVFSHIPKEYLEGVMWADDPVPPEDDVNPYPPRRDIREFLQ